MTADIIWRFKGDEPEDMERWEEAFAGWKALQALRDMDNYLRTRVKYATDDVSNEVIETYETAREHLVTIINEWGIADVVWR